MKGDYVSRIFFILFFFYWQILVQILKIRKILRKNCDKNYRRKFFWRKVKKKEEKNSSNRIKTKIHDISMKFKFLLWKNRQIERCFLLCSILPKIRHQSTKLTWNFFIVLEKKIVKLKNALCTMYFKCKQTFTYFMIFGIVKISSKWICLGYFASSKFDKKTPSSVQY